jgi:hypothetical protein
MIIEGEKLYIESQSIQPQVAPPRKYADLDGNQHKIFPVTLEVNGFGEILIQNSCLDENKNVRQRFSQQAAIAMGASIAGVRLWGFSGKPLKGKAIIVGGTARSGKHPRQHTNLEQTCYLQVIQGYTGSLVKEHPKHLLE